MEGIAKMVSKFHEHTSRKVCEVLRNKGIAEFFLTGYCPKDEIIKTFKFTLETTQFPLKSSFNRILVDEGWIECLGSGSDEANKFINKKNNISPIKLLRNIIKSGRIQSVGGSMPSCTSKTRVPQWKRTAFPVVVTKPLKCFRPWKKPPLNFYGLLWGHRVL
jgi:hypothetical protein